MTFLVQCPQCKNTMKVEPTRGPLEKKSKRCVYCGRTFKVYLNILTKA